MARSSLLPAIEGADGNISTNTAATCSWMVNKKTVTRAAAAARKRIPKGANGTR